MSYNYKSRLDDYLSGNPTKKSPEDENNTIVYYEQNPNEAKDICFVLLNGRQTSLEYNYLISRDYIPEQNIIVLNFTTHEITLNGHNLEKLFNDLRQNLPQTVTVIDERYIGISQENAPVVTDIKIERVK